MAEPVTDDDRHPTQARSRRFPQDVRLRRFGFRIHARRGDHEPVWRWVDHPNADGMLYGHAEAMELTYRLEQ